MKFDDWLFWAAFLGFLACKCWAERFRLRNHDKLGPLPLPNGDSIEPRDSSS